jgi:hypothetical protein
VWLLELLAVLELLAAPAVAIALAPAPSTAQARATINNLECLRMNGTMTLLLSGVVRKHRSALQAVDQQKVSCM